MFICNESSYMRSLTLQRYFVRAIYTIFLKWMNLLCWSLGQFQAITRLICRIPTTVCASRSCWSNPKLQYSGGNLNGNCGTHLRYCIHFLIFDFIATSKKNRVMHRAKSCLRNFCRFIHIFYSLSCESLFCFVRMEIGRVSVTPSGWARVTRSWTRASSTSKTSLRFLRAENWVRRWFWVLLR